MSDIQEWVIDIKWEILVLKTFLEDLWFDERENLVLFDCLEVLFDCLENSRLLCRHEFSKYIR